MEVSKASAPRRSGSTTTCPFRNCSRLLSPSTNSTWASGWSSRRSRRYQLWEGIYAAFLREAKGGKESSPWLGGRQMCIGHERNKGARLGVCALNRLREDCSVPKERRKGSTSTSPPRAASTLEAGGRRLRRRKAAGAEPVAEAARDAEMACGGGDTRDLVAETQRREGVLEGGRGWCSRLARGRL